jgi:myo-inositol-1(or 4)-monophosphatase
MSPSQPRGIVPDLIRDVVSVVEAAGRLVSEVARQDFQVVQKGTAGPVTEADRAADSYLRENLPRLTPADWLSEETADSPSRLASETVWIVDPLDGTREFTKGIPEYAIAVALAKRGGPELAIVHNPATRDLFWAARGLGAYRNGERIQVREGGTLLASRSEVGQGEFADLADAWQLRPMGSIALKLALVAAGEAAATLSRGPKHEWDVCAGALLVAEAGGLATDAFGEALVYNQPFPKVKGILAGAPAAHARALAQMQTLGASARMTAEFGPAGQRR